MSVKAMSSGQGRASSGSIFKAAVFNVILAVIANLIILFILRAALGLPTDFPPLQVPAILIVTVIGTSLAGAAYAIVARLSKNPNRTYPIVAVIALIVSILPNFGAMANPSSFPFPGGSATTFGVLIVFHVVAALVSIFTLTKLSGRR